MFNNGDNKDWFSYFEILEIYGQVGHKEYIQEETATRAEAQKIESQNITKTCTTTPMLTQEQRNDRDIFKESVPN